MNGDDEKRTGKTVVSLPVIDLRDAACLRNSPLSSAEEINSTSWSTGLAEEERSRLNHTVDQLKQACRQVGFFYITGVTISAVTTSGHEEEQNVLQDDPPQQQQQERIMHQLCQDVMEQSRKFFRLSETSKMAVRDTILTRGYTAMQEETLDPATQQRQGDTKEGFYVGRHVPVDDPDYHPAHLQGPNIWPSPETVPEWDAEQCRLFQSTMERYFDTLCQAALQVVRLLALALQLESPFALDSYFVKPMAALRLLHYAAIRSQPDRGLLGCGAHSDYGMITLLYTDGTPGLQIYRPPDHYKGCGDKVDNEEDWWQPVAHPPPGYTDTTTRTTTTTTAADSTSTPTSSTEQRPPCCWVVNLGDMLERWTNGSFQSTRHRVVTAGDVERYSMALFYEPAFDTCVECLPTCLTAERPKPLYPPVISGHYLLNKYRNTHADFTPVEKTTTFSEEAIASANT